MAKIRVKNVGPIRYGLPDHINNGFIEFEGVTLLVGNQGSGKSTLAKLFSTMSWLEKALVRGEFTPQALERRSFKKLLEYQNIHNYLDQEGHPHSEVFYQGVAYHIQYREKKLTVEKKAHLSYAFPKIMYTPAERNLGSSLKRASSIRGLPAPLYTFLDEYEAAKTLFQQKSLELPVAQTQFEHQALNNTSFIVGQDYKINLLEASSGFQSMVPLFITTRYLSEYVDQTLDASQSPLSISDKKMIEQELQAIAQRADLSDEQRTALEQQAQALLSYKCLINIVEEPEQNLYPSSQRQLLFELLRDVQKRPSDRLVITTHSLYWVSYLTQCLQAYEVQQAIDQLPHETRQTPQEQLNQIIPPYAALPPDHLRFYQLDVEGHITLLTSEEHLPPDDHPLNLAVEASNESFIALLELLPHGEPS